MLSHEELYPYSEPVARETVVASGALTSLPVRIHRHDELADAGAICLTGDWGRIMKDGQDKKSNGSPCRVGNWGSFIWPESEPDRLGLLCYLLDVGCFHDDACEEMSIAAAHIEHMDLDAAMDVSDDRSLSADSRSAKTKDLVSTAILECVRVDRVGALRMLEAYRKKWLAIMENYDTEKIETLDEYFESRANNGGMGAYYAMLEFSLGIVVTDEEYAMMAVPIQHVERCMLLTNDYWSWPREREQAKTQEAGKVFNTVWFMMKQNPTWTEEQAKRRVAEMVVEEETKWVQSKDALYAQYPALSPHLVKLLENLHTALAGNDYWSSQCYRHNDWTHVPEQPAPGHPQVHELAGLGRAVMPLAESPEGSAADGVKTPLSEGKSGSPLTSPSSVFSSVVVEATKQPPVHSRAEEVIQAPIRYIQSMPSKGFRSALVDCYSRWLDVPAREMESIKSVINCLHDSSLILDDIEDNSRLRRGFPATHVVYGAGPAINSATYLYVQAVAAINSLDNREMMDVLLRQLQNLFLGQSLDLHWTANRQCPTRDEYLGMVGQKTGAFISMVAELMIAASNVNSPEKTRAAFAAFSHLSGLYYQVRDDYLNITSAEYADKKGFAEDLDEQKFSYMLVHLARARPDMMVQVEGVFRSMRDGKAEVAESKRYLVGLLRASGAVDATRKLLLGWQDAIVREIDALQAHFGAPNPSLRLLMESLWIE
ncbi:geranylgeranyl pyrophosphate synthetase [Pyricularia oryzae]|uniref:Geranylgeranyl pyrophosphate synthetase n=2 Tax=Pyricularia oryzae TaxID=318829 RepID=A0AA97NZU7_PYRO3|nr:geranylgeranyl pyrophosphate synthetase [Pyricularia oryzae Y34]KAI7921068.1 geranylgeranyl pyrophosphate synthetase [Pyricularia oryzae]KAI7921143.1 geranylgeranyl pyrophosphate synthetase [Pyricularia oryzae]